MIPDSMVQGKRRHYYANPPITQSCTMLKFLSFGFLSGTPKENVMKNIGEIMSNKFNDKGDDMVFGNSSVEKTSPSHINAGSRMDELNNVLSELQTASGDIDACAVVSEDGLTMASSLPE